MAYLYIYFDVAGTLLYKERLFETIRSCLADAGFSVPIGVLRTRHGVVSGIMVSPSETSKAFYDSFNSAYLYSLGIVPKWEILDSLYMRCKQLSWTAFDDVSVLESIKIPKGIISNWDSTLESKLADLIPCTFDQVYSSARSGVVKPDKGFYKNAFTASHILMEHIVYVGDSIELDMEPAQSLGVKAILIDRDNRYPWYIGTRIRFLTELPTILQGNK
jgi:FMN phosphatase YigB (HAD superfamily)